MSTPTAVFLDTSVLAGQQYNFASTALSTFIPVAKKAGLKFLLPDPTEREVRRQIRARAQEALDALEVARRRAPFLAKWKSFPKSAQPSIDNWEVTRIATNEWNAFLSSFDVVKLGYESLNVKLVMDWYDGIAAPFREGKKRKEFPDAFAIAILDSHANKSGCFVAVVSEDQDFKLACERFPNLLYFQSLPRLTELLLSTEDGVDKYHAAIDAKADELSDVIREQMGDLSFYHEDRRFEIRDTSLQYPSVREINIVAVGDNECTITFEAEFEAEHELEWEEFNGLDEYPERVRRYVSESFNLTGTAKLRFDPKTTEMVEITYATIDDEEFGVSSTP
jgi:PIN domain